ncbi:hypothetical protein F441_04835 [Phytophthora nicotianae CJ01A1]|uniref:Uncharacterized protein n=1 Tax=Phytophthora nicotianae CJ01A1 TaxID=1317063 RepID=W2XIF2_PHYNI|nr:hypothetical protein F441_04835 [Phytophthora nicotianae CJ01A1]
MPGISALELHPASLYAGDTIEYYSMAFVSDDPRGYHTAVVLRVHEDVAADYPITVDMEELLPRDLMVRLLIDRIGDRFKPANAIWRNQHSYALVPRSYSVQLLLHSDLRTSVHDGTEQDGNEASLTTANPTNASADITHPPSPLIVRGGSLVCDNSMRSSTSGQDVEHDAGSGNICEDEGASAGSEEKASPSPGDIAPVPIDQEILDADEYPHSIPTRLE